MAENTRVYLIRHAEAEGNIRRVFQGTIDADISENGMQQLERLKERCKNYRYDAVYSSPLIRALKTAQAASFYQKLPITKVDGLREIDGGRWEGEKWEEIPKLFPDENAAWVREPWRFAPQGGESMHSVYGRIWDTIMDIVKDNVGHSILIASHGCAIRNFVCKAMNLPIERLSEVEWFENTSVTIIDFDEKFAPNLVKVNDFTHLDEETFTLTKQDWWKDSETSGVIR